MERGNAGFVLGIDAMPNLCAIAEDLDERAWNSLARPASYSNGTRRKRRANVKERIVKERAYKSIRLESEQVAEFK